MVETGAKYVFGGTQYPLYQAFHSYIVESKYCLLDGKLQVKYKGNYHGDTARIIRLCSQFKDALEHFDLFS